MNEIKKFLTEQYDKAETDIDKQRIKILLQEEVVTMCKCPNCGSKFTPEEAFKSGLIMY